MADIVISGIRRGIAGIIKRQRRLKRLSLARWGGGLLHTTNITTLLDFVPFNNVITAGLQIKRCAGMF